MAELPYSLHSLILPLDFDIIVAKRIHVIANHIHCNTNLIGQCSKLLLSIPQSVPSFVYVCVYIHAAILLCYVKIAPLMVATVAGRILLLICCLRAVMLMLGSHFYRIMRNDTF